MSDDAATTPDDEPTTPPAGDPPAPTPGDDAGTPPSGSEDPAGDPPADDAPPAGGKTVEQLERELAATRREAAKYRTKAKQAEDEAEQRRQAEMSELEKAQERAAKLEQERDAAEEARRRTAAEAAIVAAATREKFADPADAVAFVASQVEFDDDGNPIGVDERVKKLAADKPHLVTPAPGAHGGNPARPGGGQQPDTKHERYARVMGGSAAKPPWMS